MSESCLISFRNRLGFQILLLNAGAQNGWKSSLFSKVTAITKTLIARRDEQGASNNLIQKLRDEDPSGFFQKIFQVAPRVLVRDSPPCWNNV